MWHSFISLLMRQEFFSGNAGDGTVLEWSADAAPDNTARETVGLNSIQIPASTTFAECAGTILSSQVALESNQAG